MNVFGVLSVASAKELGNHLSVFSLNEPPEELSEEERTLSIFRDIRAFLEEAKTEKLPLNATSANLEPVKRLLQNILNLLSQENDKWEKSFLTTGGGKWDTATEVLPYLDALLDHALLEELVGQYGVNDEPKGSMYLLLEFLSNLCADDDTIDSIPGIDIIDRVSTIRYPVLSYPSIYRPLSLIIEAASVRIEEDVMWLSMGGT